jgi:hypothetical protein
MQNIFHLNLHREFFAALASRKSESNIVNKSPVGASDWKGGVMIYETMDKRRPLTGGHPLPPSACP